MLFSHAPNMGEIDTGLDVNGRPTDQSLESDSESTIVAITERESDLASLYNKGMVSSFENSKLFDFFKEDNMSPKDVRDMEIMSRIMNIQPKNRT